MFIDRFKADWVDVLGERIGALPEGVNVYLLLDGAFVPGMYRKGPFADRTAETVHLLFASLPGATDEVKDASPLLARIGNGGQELSERMPARLAPCDGLPMVSAIATTESLEELGKRLAVWCVVENDGQRFNFRFPDTRRLPGIYAALHPDQQAQLCGPARFWSYIGRDGAWHDLDVEAQACAIAASPKLDDAQFGSIVDDCAADEVLFRLAYSGFQSSLKHSVAHGIVQGALVTARAAQLDETMTEAWCENILRHPDSPNDRAALDQWLTVFVKEE